MIDLLIVLYVAFSAWRGRKHGLIKELPGAISIVVFFFCGCGLFNIMYRGLSQASVALGQSVGVFTFVGLLVGSVALWRKFHTRVRWLAEKWPEERPQRIGGATAGGIRAFVVVATLLLVLAHWPLHGLTRQIAESSFIGRGLIRLALPVYEKTHGAL